MASDENPLIVGKQPPRSFKQQQQSGKKLEKGGGGHGISREIRDHRYLPTKGFDVISKLRSGFSWEKRPKKHEIGGHSRGYSSFCMSDYDVEVVDIGDRYPQGKSEWEEHPPYVKKHNKGDRSDRHRRSDYDKKKSEREEHPLGKPKWEEHPPHLKKQKKGGSSDRREEPPPPVKQHGKRGPSDRRVDINSILSSSLSEGEKVTQLEAFFELIDDTDDIDDTKEDRDYYEKVYLPALRASEGFDVPVIPWICCGGNIQPEPIVDSNRDLLFSLAKEGIKIYEKEKDDGIKYEVVEVVNFMRQIVSGFNCFITFLAKRTDSHEPETFETKAYCGIGVEPSVDFCRKKKKPDLSKVSLEQIIE